MEIKISSFSESNAKIVCSWKYENQYSVYNLPEWNIAKIKKLGITNSVLREKEFKSIYNNDILIGYFRVVEKEDYLSLGIGICPKYCGMRLSNIIIPIILNFIKINYPPKTLRLVVREFNKRAIKAYEKFGFISKGYILSKTPSGIVKCKLMINNDYF